MVTSEDLEMLSHIQAKGWEIWYNPAMQLTTKFLTGVWNASIDSVFSGNWVKPPCNADVECEALAATCCHCRLHDNDLRKIAFHLLKHGVSIRSDLIAACEMELFVSSLVSPFYLWKHGYFNRED
jgi:hypothetical protein